MADFALGPTRGVQTCLCNDAIQWVREDDLFTTFRPYEKMKSENSSEPISAVEAADTKAGLIWGLI